MKYHAAGWKISTFLYAQNCIVQKINKWRPHKMFIYSLNLQTMAKMTYWAVWLVQNYVILFRLLGYNFLWKLPRLSVAYAVHYCLRWGYILMHHFYGILYLMKCVKICMVILVICMFICMVIKCRSSASLTPKPQPPPLLVHRASI